MSKWPHAPARREITAGTYIVTAGTYKKAHLFRGKARLDLLERTLMLTLQEFEWQLQCWAVFSNHHHFIASSELEQPALGQTMKMIHGRTSRELNQLDHARGRQVWFRYWDTRITNQRSYFARLAYVHRNPVRHRLVPAPEMYEWCSADWFAKTAETSLYETVLSFPTDRVSVVDDFEPVPAEA